MIFHGRQLTDGTQLLKQGVAGHRRLAGMTPLRQQDAASEANRPHKQRDDGDTDHLADDRLILFFTHEPASSPESTKFVELCRFLSLPLYHVRFPPADAFVFAARKKRVFPTPAAPLCTRANRFRKFPFLINQFSR